MQRVEAFTLSPNGNAAAREVDGARRKERGKGGELERPGSEATTTTENGEGYTSIAPTKAFAKEQMQTRTETMGGDGDGYTDVHYDRWIWMYGWERRKGKQIWKR